MSCCCGLCIVRPCSGEEKDLSDDEFDTIPVGTSIGALCGRDIRYHAPSRLTFYVSSVLGVAAVALSALGGILQSFSIWPSVALYVGAGVCAGCAVYQVARNCFSIPKIDPDDDEETPMQPLSKTVLVVDTTYSKYHTSELFVVVAADTSESKKQGFLRNFFS